MSSIINRLNKPKSTRPMVTCVPNLLPSTLPTCVPMKRCIGGICVNIISDTISPHTNHIAVLKTCVACFTLIINGLQNYKFFSIPMEITAVFFLQVLFFTYFCSAYTYSDYYIWRGNNYNKYIYLYGKCY